MSKILAASRYLTIIAVIALLTAALAAFGWGVTKTIDAIHTIVVSAGEDKSITVSLVQIVDAFLIATTLLLFSLGLYELSIAEVKLPEWMIVHNLHDLKAKLGSMIVLIMAAKFLEKLADWKNAQEMLLFAISIALISGTLIAFSALGGKD